jgi:hypothetical protein
MIQARKAAAALVNSQVTSATTPNAERVAVNVSSTKP